MKKLGERIRELREAKDLSLREFARRLGDLSAAFVSDVELSHRFPSEKVLVKMASVLGVRPEDLMSHDTRPPVEEFKRLAAADPTYGVLLRTLIDKKIDPSKVTNFILKAAEKKNR